ncbi:MAG TPA: hypothetical protein VF952_09455 [Chloroflexia bacterium]|jgi:hypothetical protein
MRGTTLRRKGWRSTLAGLMLGSLLGAGGEMLHAQAGNEAFADPSFRRLWERTDAPVAQARASRTWVWGPTPGRSRLEPFKEGANGAHLVQYFDKARMEVNNPNADPSSPFYVTNGLLVVEMISGRIQTGVNEFEPVLPNDLLIAGDPGSNAPTYAALSKVASVGLQGQDNRDRPLDPRGSFPSLFINSDGEWTGLPPYSVPAQFRPAVYIEETGHNIPDVFWEYLRSEGLVYEEGSYVTGKLFDWVSSFGYPITEAYWTRIKVAGEDRLVLFQAFQRRILTYSPMNPLDWQVEMGNVGAQYYSWRYADPK